MTGQRRQPLTAGSTDDERGVSDLVAFTLTFSVIIASIGFVSLYGIDTLEHMGDQSRIDTAQSSMYAVDAAMDGLARDDLPRRQLNLDLGGDSLARHNSELRVTVTNSSGDAPLDTNVKVGTFVRETGRDVRFTYAAGAMFRIQDRGTTVLDEPAMGCGSDTAHLSIVHVTGDVNVSTYGIATVTAVTRERTALYPDTRNASTDHATEVTVDVADTEHPDAWQRLDWEGRGWSQSGTTFTCDGVERAYVHHTVVELDAIG